MLRKVARIVLIAAVAIVALPVLLFFAVKASMLLANRGNATLASSGVKREYLVHVPKGLDRSKPAPLVISLHGAAGWPALQAEMSQWNKLADEQGFIVAYPAGLATFPKIWRVLPQRTLDQDVRFVSDLLDKLQADHNVDPGRVYADGLSNGGAMAFAISCVLSQRIAAVGLVAAAHALPPAWCKAQRPMPVIAFHGTADRIIPYLGGPSPVSPPSMKFPSVAEFMAAWAQRNRCAPKPVEARFAPDVTRFEYPACADGAAVVLYRIDDGSHTWPGGPPVWESLIGTPSKSVDATREMWAFFKDRRLPARTSSR